MSTVTLKLITPSVPNFIRIEMPPGIRGEGHKELPALDIADLSEQQLREIASDWQTELFRAAEARRRTKPAPDKRGEGKS